MKGKISIIGGGSFGSSLGYHLGKKYNKKDVNISIYSIEPEVVKEINNSHTNSKYAGNIVFPNNITATDNVQKSLENAKFILLAVPAQAIRNVCINIKSYIPNNVTIINVAKGLEIGTFKRISQIVAEELKTLNNSYKFVTLSGPTFAKDIFNNSHIGITVGGKERKVLFRVRKLLDTPTFDVKITTDLIGVELGGSLKNVFAIMAGMMHGLGMGESIAGDFLTRSIVDMKSIAMYMGARRCTLDGRPGLGDLAISCTPHSRNFCFGQKFVQIYDNLKNTPDFPDQILSKTFESLNCKTIEGYYTLKPLYNFCKQKNIFVPIVTNLYSILYLNSCTPPEAIDNYRILDKIRIREGNLNISKILHFLFPRIWYRRERGFFAKLFNKTIE